MRNPRVLSAPTLASLAFWRSNSPLQQPCQGREVSRGGAPRPLRLCGSPLGSSGDGRCGFERNFKRDEGSAARLETHVGRGARDSKTVLPPPDPLRTERRRYASPRPTWVTSYGEGPHERRNWDTAMRNGIVLSSVAGPAMACAIGCGGRLAAESSSLEEEGDGGETAADDGGTTGSSSGGGGEQQRRRQQQRGRHDSAGSSAASTPVGSAGSWAFLEAATGRATGSVGSWDSSAAATAAPSAASRPA